MRKIKTEYELIVKFKKMIDRNVSVAIAKKRLNIYQLSYAGKISPNGQRLIYDLCEDSRIKKHMLSK